MRGDSGWLRDRVREGLPEKGSEGKGKGGKKRDGKGKRNNRSQSRARPDSAKG